MFRPLAVLAFLLLASPALANPAVWVAHGPHATVYLLGSVHMLRPGTVWETPAVRRAFDEASECWFEIEQPDDPQQMGMAMAAAGMDPAHKLSDLLPPSRRAQLDTAATRAGMGATIQVMRPWLAALVLVVQPLQKAGYDPALGVDTVLQAKAKAAGKRVAGVETAESQLRLMTGLPPALSIQLLTATLDDVGKGTTLIDDMIRGWQSGDTAAIARTVTGGVRKESPELYRTIFTKRNETFAHAVEGFLAGDKTVLLTVGAGHLAGPDNVRDLLAARGVKVERVPD